MGDSKQIGFGETVIPMRVASREAEAWFWWARRQLGLRDLDVYPQVDHVIKEELELYSLAENTVSLERVRARLNIPLKAF